MSVPSFPGQPPNIPLNMQAPKKSNGEPVAPTEKDKQYTQAALASLAEQMEQSIKKHGLPPLSQG
jgi:hypothetical protein